MMKIDSAVCKKKKINERNLLLLLPVSKSISNKDADQVDIEAYLIAL